MAEKQENDFKKIFAQANSSIPDIAAVGRIAGFGVASKFAAVRQVQLKRECERALKAGNAEKVARLQRRIQVEKSHELSLVNMAQREQIQPPKVAKDTATIIGRVTCDGCGAKNYRVTLTGTGKKKLDSQVTSANGAFELTTRQPGKAKLIVSDKKGKIIKAVELEKELKPGRLKFLETDISGLSPVDEIPPIEPDRPDAPDAKIKVPELRGLAMKPAEKTAKKLGLALKSMGFVDDRKNIDLISEQKPAADGTVEVGSTIEVKLGRKPLKKMPEIEGMPIAEAFDKLAREKLDLTNVEVVKDPKKAGTVVDQFPPKDAAIRPDSQVRLRIGAGDDRQNFKIALTLLSHDKNIKALDMPAADLGRRFKTAKVGNFDELRKFARGKQVNIQKSLNLQKPETAKLMKATLTKIIKKFPGRSVGQRSVKTRMSEQKSKTDKAKRR